MSVDLISALISALISSLTAVRIRLRYFLGKSPAYPDGHVDLKQDGVSLGAEVQGGSFEVIRDSDAAREVSNSDWSNVGALSVSVDRVS